MQSLTLGLEHLLAVYLAASMATQGRIAWRLGSRGAGRSAMYWRTIVWQWGMTALLCAAVPISTLVAPAAGRSRVDPALLFVVIANIVAATYMPVALAWSRGRLRRQMLAPFAPVRALLPTTPAQRALWALLSLTTGVCEELLFRGFALHYLAQPPLGMSAAAAALVSSLLFGLGHGNQGWHGILRTAGFGLAMCTLTAAAGSLLPAIGIHIAINLRLALLPGSPAPAAAPRPATAR